MKRFGAHSAMMEAHIQEADDWGILGLRQRPSRRQLSTQYFATVVAVAAGSCG
jgi:hypothetical protein